MGEPARKPEQEEVGDETIIDSPDLRKKIQKAAGLIDKHRKLKAAQQAKVNEQFESAAAWGIPKSVMKAAIDRCAMDPDVMLHHDNAFAIACAALGHPLQIPLLPVGED